MNFLDTYDVPGSVTPTSNQPEQSLNEEVSQVIGQLGRFWGGIRERVSSSFYVMELIYDDETISRFRANLSSKLRGKISVVL